MAVIGRFRLPASAFELGDILDVTGGTSVTLENLVPLGEKAVPFFSVHGDTIPDFQAKVGSHSSVSVVKEVSAHDGRRLYALDWQVGNDAFFRGIEANDAHVLSATGGPDTWTFDLRFPSHEALANFQEYCEAEQIPLEIGRIYNPARPEGGPFYGLTPPQRETLVRAVEGGYYAIPRQLSTKELSQEFGISDQAVTERLRRAIMTLVENSVFAAMAESEFDTVE